jgi:hypothetical protein
MNEITGEGTPLEIANAHERTIQLGGPDHMMPDGRTVAETRADLQAQHEIEGAATAATQLARVREQSIAGDPLYAQGAKVVANETGGATIVSASTPEVSAEQAETAIKDGRAVVSKIETPKPVFSPPQTSVETDSAK